MEISKQELKETINKLRHRLSELENLENSIEKEIDCLSVNSDFFRKNYIPIQTKIFDEEGFSTVDNNDLEKLGNIMSSIANLDFTEKAEISDERNEFDFLGLNLNIMQIHLEDSFKALSRMQNYFDSINSLILITDSKGKILDTNDYISNLGFSKKEIISRDTSIKEFLFSKPLLHKYGLDITGTIIEHDIERLYLANLKSEIVLRVTIRSTHFPQSGTSGYFYIVEPVSKALYENQNYGSMSPVKNSIQSIANSDQIQKFEHLKVLNSIKQTYLDKGDLSLMEKMILNSVSSLIDDN